MGNVVTLMVTTVSPLITKEYLIPKLMHPTQWGGIPFKPPSTIKYMLMYVFFNLMLIGSAATLSGLMTTARECGKYNLRTALGNSWWAMLFGFLGIIVVSMFSFIKAPVLALLSWLPYANHLVTGLYIAIFVLIGGMIGNNYNRRDVCLPPTIPTPIVTPTQKTLAPVTKS